MRTVLSLGLGLAAAAATLAPAAAQDLNSLRRAHKLPPLAMSGPLSAAAAEHANDMARRNHLDHNGFKRRIGAISSAAAENVAYGCDTETCAFKMWSRSAGHRRNMLLRGVSAYGIASATSANGRRYWVLELGN